MKLFIRYFLCYWFSHLPFRSLLCVSMIFYMIFSMISVFPLNTNANSAKSSDSSIRTCIDKINRNVELKDDGSEQTSPRRQSEEVAKQFECLKLLTVKHRLQWTGIGYQWSDGTFSNSCSEYYDSKDFRKEFSQKNLRKEKNGSVRFRTGKAKTDWIRCRFDLGNGAWRHIQDIINIGGSPKAPSFFKIQNSIDGKNAISREFLILAHRGHSIDFDKNISDWNSNGLDLHKHIFRFGNIWYFIPGAPGYPGCGFQREPPYFPMSGLGIEKMPAGILQDISIQGDVCRYGIKPNHRDYPHACARWIIFRAGDQASLDGISDIERYAHNKTGEEFCVGDNLTSYNISIFIRD